MLQRKAGYLEVSFDILIRYFATSIKNIFNDCKDCLRKPVLQPEMRLTAQHGGRSSRLISIYITNMEKILIIKTVDVKLKLYRALCVFLKFVRGIGVVPRVALFFYSSYCCHYTQKSI